MTTESTAASKAEASLDAQIARTETLTARARALFDEYQAGAEALVPALRELRAIRVELDAAFAAASRVGRDAELARHPDAVRRPTSGRALQEEVLLPAADGPGMIWPEPAAV
jgi:hypothetical protein